MIRPDWPIRPSCPIPSTRYRAPLVKHYGLTYDEIAIVEGKFENHQELQYPFRHRQSNAIVLFESIYGDVLKQ